MNVEEVAGQYRITAPMPGFKPEEVNISYVDGSLTLSGRRSEENETASNGYLRQEVIEGNYRQICIGEVGP